MTQKIEDQYMLRVKRNSELDKALRALDEADYLTNTAVNLASGYARTASVVRAISKSFDNLHIEGRGENMSMRYVNVNPVAPVAIGQDVLAQVQASVVAPMSAELPTVSDIRWPQAPPLVDSIGDAYRKPAWYSTMKAMVAAGRHIALSGPPSVGKDTGVQELAAEEGRILVTIGGDGGFRRRDLVGSMQIAGGRSFFDVAEYAAAAINGWWVLLSEVNAADADALLYINTQLAAPNVVNVAGKAYAVHPDFRLFITYNPGLAGTKPLPPSFKDRFFSIQVPFFTQVQLQNVLISHGAPADTEWVTELCKFGIAVWKAHERGQIRYQVTSRRLMDAVVLMQAGIAQSTVEAMELSVVAAVDSPVEQNVIRQTINLVRSA